MRRGIKVTTGKRITDPTSGMRLFGRSVLKEFANNINYGPEPDTISFLIKKAGYYTEREAEKLEKNLFMLSSKTAAEIIKTKTVI